MLCATWVLWSLLQWYLVNSNRNDAHYRIFSIPLFLPPSHTKYSPHHPALTKPQSVFSWHKTANFIPTQKDRNNVSLIDKKMQYPELNGSKYCLNLPCSFFPKIMVLKFCQDLTYLKPDLQQSKCYTSQAMWHEIQSAQGFTRRTAYNPFSTVKLLQEYRLSDKPEILSIS